MDGRSQLEILSLGCLGSVALLHLGYTRHYPTVINYLDELVSDRNRLKDSPDIHSPITLFRMSQSAESSPMSENFSDLKERMSSQDSRHARLTPEIQEASSVFGGHHKPSANRCETRLPKLQDVEKV